MRIVITGANGFIGSYIIQALFKNHEILAISLQNDNIKHYNNIYFLSGGNSNLISLKNKILDFKPNCFIFNGWSGGQSFDYTNNFEQLSHNTYPLISFLNDIKNDLTDALLIGIGSGAEFGHITKPITESDKEYPVSLYGLSKIMFRDYLRYFSETHGFRWLWLRPCTLYGYKDVETRLIPTVIRTCLEGKTIHLSDCLIMMNYLHIEDFISALIKLIDSDAVGLFNVGTHEQVLVKEVVMLINKIIGNGQITFNSKLNRANFPNYVCVNITKIINTIGKFYRYNLNDGLINVINQYKNDYI